MKKALLDTGRGKRIICLMAVALFLMMVLAPAAHAQLSFEQGEEIIHELEEIAHELEHIEEWLRLVAFASIGIFLALVGQLAVQWMAYKKK